MNTLEEDTRAQQSMLDPLVIGKLDPDTASSVGNGSILLQASSLLPHKFSIRQMRSLIALCDTFVPCLNYYDRAFWGDKKEAPSVRKDDDVDEMQAFYQLSASEEGVPEYVAGLMHCRLKPRILQFISWVLWLLSTRLGTFLLCGRGSLSNKFPYFLSFPMISFAGREDILLKGWGHNDGIYFRVLFKIFKNFIMHGMYSKVNHVHCNRAWKAIGYCGPDPVATSYHKSFKAKPERCYKPLDNRVIDVQSAKLSSIYPILENAGFAVIEDASHLAKLWSPKRGSFSGGKPVGIKCDAVILGSGSGGGVAAGVLAQAGFKVLVLEKGKYYAREDLSLLEGPSFGHLYEEGCLLTTKDGSIAILAGSTVGGGSALNWAASFRTPASVLAEWEKEHKLSMFTSMEYQRAMDTVCTRLGVQGSVERENLQNTILRKGCEELGYHIETVSRNSQPDHFCGWCGFGCWNGNKQATSETWLVDATRSGAIVLAGCKALVALHKENSPTNGKRRKSVGIVASTGSEQLFIEARVTIVACGSLQTPPLLLRSGLQNANIGKNLHLHPVQMVWGYFPEDKGPEGTSYEGGIITTVSKEVINLNPPNYGCILENPSLHPGSFSAMMPWLSGLDHKQTMRRYARTVHVFALARDVGSGIVEPNGHIDYLLQEIDEENLKEGGERALRVLIAAGAEDVGTHHQDGDRLKVKGAGSAEVEDFLRRVRSKGIGKLCVPMCSAHQMSSCRMGVDASSSVVDPEGETWEVEGLFVTDASVLPTAIGVNPMITVQSLAFCTAQHACQYLKAGHRH
eukprot:c6703_g1_i1 orf=215-2605(-)